MKDRQMTCVQCGNQFALTSVELERLVARGFGLPRRCTDCRKRKSKNAHEVHDEWEYKKKRKPSRRERNFFEDDI